MDEVDYTYDGKFEGNILVVGRTGCGKTTFVQSIGYRKLNFLLKEKTESRTVLRIKLLTLNIRALWKILMIC